MENPSIWLRLSNQILGRFRNGILSPEMGFWVLWKQRNGNTEKMGFQNPIPRLFDETLGFSVHLIHTSHSHSSSSGFFLLVERKEGGRDTYSKNARRLLFRTPRGDSNLRTTHYSISCLVCLPSFRSKGTWWSYVNQFNYTNIYPVLSTAKPNFHLSFAG